MIILSVPFFPAVEPARSAPAEAHEGPNLVVNPGFEAGSLLPSAWASPVGEGVAVRQSVSVYNGTAALQIASGGVPPDLAKTVRSTRIPMMQGATVSATALVMEEIGKLELRLGFLDHAGALRSSVVLPHESSASWQPIAVRTVAPACTAAVEFTIRAVNAAGYVDDVYVSAVLPPEPPQALFREDWDSGLQGWSSEFGRVTTPCEGTPPPALLLDPDCCSRYARAIRHGLDIPLTEPTRLTFDFKGGNSRSSDADVVVSLSAQSAVALLLTGGSTNRVLTLQVDDHGDISRAVSFTWSSGTWYRPSLLLDPVLGEVVAEVRDLEGNLLANPVALQMPAGEDTFADLVFQAIEYQSESAAYMFDSIRIERAPMPTLLYTESWESGFGSWEKSYDVAEIDCSSGRSGCSLMQDPLCCGTYVNVTDPNLAIGLWNVTLASFWFSGTGSSQTDAHFQLGLSDKHSISMHLNGGSSNQELTLQMVSKYSVVNAPFFVWAAGEWYEVRFRLDLVAQTVQAEVRDAEGEVLARSRQLSLPAGETRLDSVSIQARDNVAESAAHWFDSIVIYGRES